jgi:hypothetical protein
VTVHQTRALRSSNRSLTTQQSGSTPETETTLKLDTASLPQVEAGLQCLPNEIMTSIIDILAAEGQFGTLANAARASKLMYDIVIPKLYNTIYITEKNRLYFTYGCTMADLGLPDGTCSLSPGADDQITLSKAEGSLLGRIWPRHISARSFSRPCLGKT